MCHCWDGAQRLDVVGSGREQQHKQQQECGQGHGRVRLQAVWTLMRCKRDGTSLFWNLKCAVTRVSCRSWLPLTGQQAPAGSKSASKITKATSSSLKQRWQTCHSHGRFRAKACSWYRHSCKMLLDALHQCSCRSTTTSAKRSMLTWRHFLLLRRLSRPSRWAG